MRYKALLVYFLTFPMFIAQAQNLVPNPGFETGTCPTNHGEIHRATPWYQPSMGTTDYFHVCGATSPSSVSIPQNMLGWQNARTGNAYAGFSPYIDNSNYSYREYLQAPLTTPLVAGTLYYVCFYVSRADNFTLATDAIAAYFSTDTLLANHDTVLLVSPQISNPAGNIITDTMNWTLIAGSFVAAGGERYITIGNFRDNPNTTEQYMGPNAFYGSYYYIDDVSVSANPLECELTGVSNYGSALELSVYPNPVINELNVSYHLQNTEFVSVNVYASTGKLVKAGIKKHQDQGLHTEVISLTDLAEGIYFVEISGSSFLLRRKFVICR